VPDRSPSLAANPLRLLADSRHIKAAQIGVGPAQHAHIIDKLGASFLRASVGQTHAGLKAGPTGFQETLEDLAYRGSTLSRAPRGCKLENLLHQRRIAR